MFVGDLWSMHIAEIPEVQMLWRPLAAILIMGCITAESFTEDEVLRAMGSFVHYVRETEVCIEEIVSCCADHWPYWGDSQDDNTPEGIFQNILAITLTFLLAIAAGLTLLRLTLVVWTLIAAAVRYTVIAVLILFLFIFFLP